VPADATADTGLDLVTGAFGNTGSVIAGLLHRQGRRVRTLTNSPAAPDAGTEIEVRPYAFDDPDALRSAFDGVTTFYNTYWIRTGVDGRYEIPVANSTALLEAAAAAGVQRIVQLSVIKPSAESPYPYFRAKAQVEAAARATRVPLAVVRPALLFGPDAPLIDNLAWLLRRVPVFAVAGDGQYRVRPVHVDDLAALCVELGATRDDVTVDAVGPERPTFDELVAWVRGAVGSRARVIHLPASIVAASSRLLGAVLRDDVATRDELVSTMEGIADSDAPATGSILLSEWIRQHGDSLGHDYRNEHKRRAP
jgi:NADH dehydrogenase